MDSLDIARSVVSSLEEKKAEDIVLLDLQGTAPMGDYYVICSANNERALNTLADATVRELKGSVPKPSVEGTAREGWILADFGNVIVHILSNAQRSFYQLEDLWTDAKVLLHMQ